MIKWDIRTVEFTEISAHYLILKELELKSAKFKGKERGPVSCLVLLSLMADDILVSGETHMEDRGPTVRRPFA